MRFTLHGKLKTAPVTSPCRSYVAIAAKVPGNFEVRAMTERFNRRRRMAGKRMVLPIRYVDLIRSRCERLDIQSSIKCR